MWLTHMLHSHINCVIQLLKSIVTVIVSISSSPMVCAEHVYVRLDICAKVFAESSKKYVFFLCVSFYFYFLHVCFFCWGGDIVKLAHPTILGVKIPHLRYLYFVDPPHLTRTSPPHTHWSRHTTTIQLPVTLQPPEQCYSTLPHKALATLFVIDLCRNDHSKLCLQYCSSWINQIIWVQRWVVEKLLLVSF